MTTANQKQTTGRSDIDYALFATDLFKKPKADQATVSKYRPLTEKISFYGVSKNLGTAQRAAIVIQMLDYIDEHECTDSEIEAWFWTLTEVLFPGLYEELFSAAKIVNFERIEMKEPQINYLIGGGSIQERRTFFLSKHASLPADQHPVDDDLEVVDSPGFDLLPELEFNDELMEKNLWLPLINVYGIVVFSIGKTPTAKNISA